MAGELLYDPAAIPKFLSAEELAAQQAAERSETLAGVTTPAPQSDPFSVASERQDGPNLDYQPPTEAPAVPVHPQPVNDVVDDVVDIDAQQLATASEGMGELIAAMILAARVNADRLVEHLQPSIGREYSRMTLALQSLRTMMEDDDTAETIGPVAVTALDYLTTEMMSWLDGTRIPTGLTHPLVAD